MPKSLTIPLNQLVSRFLKEQGYDLKKLGRATISLGEVGLAAGSGASVRGSLTIDVHDQSVFCRMEFCHEPLDRENCTLYCREHHVTVRHEELRKCRTLF